MRASIRRGPLPSRAAAIASSAASRTAMTSLPSTCSPGEARGDRLLRQRLACRLQPERHRDGPLVVVDDEDDGQPLDAGEVHRLVHVALGGRAVAEKADRDARLLAELEGVGDAGGMRRLRAHGNAERESRAPDPTRDCRARRRPSRAGSPPSSPRARAARRCRGRRGAEHPQVAWRWRRRPDTASCPSETA